MKFSIHRLAFLKSLNDVLRVIPVRSTIPILTGIKLDLSHDGLLLTGSDSEVSIETIIAINDDEAQLNIHQQGSIVLPARFFAEIVKKLPADSLTVTVDQNLQATITAGTASFTLNGIDANSYPHLPEVDSNDKITLPVPLFRQVILQTAIAISNQESRPILTGIHLVIKDGILKAVATDSHRLSQRIIPLQLTTDAATVEHEITVPGKILVELSKIIEGLDTIELSLSENQVLFKTDQLSFYSRVLEGRYPDTDRLITNESVTSLTIVANELLAAVERASLMSHVGNNNIVKLSLTKDRVLLTGQSPEIGTVEEELTFEQLDGENLEISFNPDYLKDALRPFGQTEVLINFISAMRPFTLTPKEKSSAIENSFIQLITPVRTF